MRARTHARWGETVPNFSKRGYPVALSKRYGNLCVVRDAGTTKSALAQFWPKVRQRRLATGCDGKGFLVTPAIFEEWVACLRCYRPDCRGAFGSIHEL